jgi:hypothetical protein
VPSTTVEIKGKDKTSKAFLAVNKNLDKLKGSVTGMGVALAAVSAGFAVWFSKMKEQTDRVGKVSNQINITAESLQKLQFAAGQGGVSLGKFDKSLQKFSENIGKALTGTKKQVDAFNSLNVSIKDTEGKTKSLDRIFLEVAHGFMLLKDQATISKTAIDLFGGAGVDLLPLLKSGSESITNLGDRLKLVGGVISNEAVPATESFNDNVDLLSNSFKNKFSPIIIFANEAIKQFTKEERIATMTLSEKQDALQEEIDNLASLRVELEKTTPKEGILQKALKLVGVETENTSEIIQEKINVLVKNRNSLEKQIEAQKKAIEVERLALIEQNKILNSDEKLAEANQIITDSTYELNDAVLSQNNLYTGQIETLEELMIKKQEALEADMLFHQEEMAMLAEFDAEYKSKAFDRAVQDAKDAKAKKKLEQDSLKSSLGTIETLASGVKDQSIEMFRIYQAAAIANTTISTLEAATKALTAGPIAGPILAGVIYGLGMANVAKIASENYQGRYMGGDISSNKSYIVGERGPEIFNPGRTGSITPNNSISKPSIVNVNINAVDATGIDELLTQRRGLLVSLINQSLQRSTRAPL